MDKEVRLMQKRALKRWEFECEQNDVYKAIIDNISIVWNIKHQIGAYTIDNDELNLLLNWDMLDELMQQTSIY